MKRKIAIIGAGLSGMTLASRLQPHAEVAVFEKSRGAGGRMATRQHESFAFDHGAQFFTARDTRFAEFLAPWLASGLVQEWKGKVVTLDPDRKMADRIWFEPHYVACPGMNNLCKAMYSGLTVHFNCEVAPLAERSNQGWVLKDAGDRSLGNFDLVVSTAPPIQTTRLFALHLPVAEALQQARFLGCYTLMLGYRQRWDRPWIAAKVNNSPLDWISINSTKPGRNRDQTCMVIHSSNLWADAHIDHDLDEVKEFLSGELAPLLDIDPSLAEYTSLHRWRYAMLDRAQDDDDRLPAYFDEHLNLASAGDWGSKSRVEDVWLEADQLATRILAQ